MSEMSEISDREDEVEEPEVDASYFSGKYAKFLFFMSVVYIKVISGEDGTQ